MDQRLEIELRCNQKARELLDKDFPHFIEDVALTQPESLTEAYNSDLPAKVAEEFLGWLAGIWEEVRTDGQKSFDKVMNLKRSIEMTDASYVPYLDDARNEAERVTF